MKTPILKITTHRFLAETLPRKVRKVVVGVSAKTFSERICNLNTELVCDLTIVKVMAAEAKEGDKESQNENKTRFLTRDDLINGKWLYMGDTGLYGEMPHLFNYQWNVTVPALVRIQLNVGQ